MKVFKGIAITLVVLILAGCLAIMFLPIDSFVAQRMAKAQGYDVPDEYEDVLYRYYYNKLNSTEQLAYRIIDSAFFANEEDGFPKQIIVPALSDAELQEVFTALSYDNPEYYFLGNKCSMTSMGSINYFVPQYLLTMEDYKESWTNVKAKADEIVSSLSGLSDFDKEVLIHDFIVQNCEYAESGTSMIYTMQGVLADQYANCEGYSRTAQYLLRECGIYNYLAIGEAEGTQGNPQGHMWNIVKIDGELYNLDVTWDDYAVATTVEFPDNSVSHVYFNISTEDLKSTHSVDDESVWKDCKAESFGYFKTNGTYYSSYDASAISSMKSALTKALNEGYNSVEFAFANESLFNTAFDSLMNKDMYGIINAANNQVAAGYRVSPTSVQYALDESKYIIRFFFIK